MIYSETVKDRTVEIAIRILQRGYFIVFILDNMKENIIKRKYKKEYILWFKMLDENRSVLVCKSYDKLLIDRVLKLMSDATWNNDCKMVVVFHKVI